MKGLSKGRYDETFAGEDGVLGTQKNHLNETVLSDPPPPPHHKKIYLKFLSPQKRFEPKYTCSLYGNIRVNPPPLGFTPYQVANIGFHAAVSQRIWLRKNPVNT